MTVDDGGRAQLHYHSLPLHAYSSSTSHDHLFDHTLSRPSPTLEDHSNPPPDLHHPRRQDEGRPGNHKHARKDFQPNPPSRSLKYCPGNRVRCQPAYTRSQEGQPVPKADLFERRYLRHQGRHERYVRPGEDAEEHRERDSHRVGVGRHPHGQNQDAGDVARDDKDVEPARFVGEEARAEAADETGNVISMCFSGKTRDVAYLAAL